MLMFQFFLLLSRTELSQVASSPTLFLPPREGVTITHIHSVQYIVRCLLWRCLLVTITVPYTSLLKVFQSIQFPVPFLFLLKQLEMGCKVAAELQFQSELLNYSNILLSVTVCPHFDACLIFPHCIGRFSEGIDFHFPHQDKGYLEGRA